jgi:hypothetical protein
MATCYRCGAPDANYRRTTYTGFSTGSWSSKRSYGSGTRTYYGVRSVCQDCARSIDNWNRIKLVFWTIVFGGVIFYFSSQPKNSQSSRSAFEYSGQTAKIIAAKGLNLRDRPSSSGGVVLTIGYNETVGILDENGLSETINGKTANWYKVDYKGTTGWLWSGYLRKQ